VQQEKEGLGLYDLAKVLISPLFSSFSFSNQEKNVSMLMLELGIRGTLMLK
jgi:hypothetical protein